MTASSVSTYLDVTQSASGGTPTRGATPEHPATEVAAKVLAAIHGGTEIVGELPEKTGLSTEVVLSSAAWLSENGLVTLDRSDGTVRAHLTDPAKAALTSA